MKKLIFGLILATAFILSSCGPKGGTIEIKNEAVYSLFGGTATITGPLKVTITCLVPPVSKSGEIPENGSKTFTFDEDGTYTIALDIISGDALTIAAGTFGIKPNPASVTLSGGNSKTVTLKKSDN